jgi:DNA integrity scanning protein DisA with diadenylate cyclase activity
MFDRLCDLARWCPKEVVESTLELAVEIAREGREGRRVGTLFTLGRADAVTRLSRPLILDPIAMHPPEARRITDPDLRGTVKELAQLDGAFIVDEAGIVVAACRYLETSIKDLEIAFGLGGRHVAAASISKATGTLGIVVSESAVVRIYHNGRLQAEIFPELWLLSRHGSHLRGRVHQDNIFDVAVLTAEEPETK